MAFDNGLKTGQVPTFCKWDMPVGPGLATFFIKEALIAVLTMWGTTFVTQVIMNSWVCESLCFPESQICDQQLHTSVS